MGLSGGGDRALLRPIEHREDVRGCHIGGSAALNVRNPQPGFAYYYELAKPGKLMTKLSLGWEIVKGKDPEQWGAELPPEVQREIDTVRAFKDVVLLRCPMEKYREMKAEKQHLSDAMTGGAEAAYLDRGERMRARFGNTAPERDLYYKRSIHSGG